ncbi:hypothetical protein RSAG8_01343, partial [Rhizoctonia solani AG-8 WAC10335]
MSQNQACFCRVVFLQLLGSIFSDFWTLNLMDCVRNARQHDVPRPSLEVACRHGWMRNLCWSKCTSA